MVSDAAARELTAAGIEFQSALRFAVVSDVAVQAHLHLARMVSIRFEVRGGFRRQCWPHGLPRRVSIRFEVRGGFRRHELSMRLALDVSIRFEVRGGFRPGSPTWATGW